MISDSEAQAAADRAEDDMSRLIEDAKKWRENGPKLEEYVATLRRALMECDDGHFVSYYLRECRTNKFAAKVVEAMGGEKQTDKDLEDYIESV